MASAAVERAPGALEGVELRGARSTKRRLVDLHLAGARLGKQSEQLRVDLRQALELVERPLGSFESRRKLYGPITTGLVATLGRRAQRLGPVVGAQIPRLTGLELGDEVVVVGVEPLRHLERALVPAPAREGEVVGERSRSSSPKRAGIAPSAHAVSSTWS